MLHGNAPTCIGLCLLALAQLAWLAPAITGRAVLFARDILSFRVPYLEEFGRQLESGTWPLWSVAMGGGMPLWHHPGAELADPMALLSALLPAPQAFALSLWMHMVAAAVGAALAARVCRVPPWWAAWVGILYACGGPAASLWSITSITPAALPWLVWAGGLCARPQRSTWALAVPVSTAVLMLKPDPLYLVSGCAAASAVALGAAHSGLRWHAWRRLTVGCATGALLAGPFLVPAALAVLHSGRMGVPPTPPSWTAAAWVELLAPGGGGVLSSSGMSAGLRGLGEVHGLVVSSFMGVSAWAVALRCGRRNALTSPLTLALVTCAGALTAVAALGGLAPVARLVADSGNRFPDKVLLAGHLCMLLALARAGAAAQRVHGGRAGAQACAGLGVMMVVAHPWLAGVVTGAAAPPGAPAEMVDAASMILGRGLLLGGGVAILVALVPQRWRGRAVLAPLLVVAAVVEGMTQVTTLLPMAEAEPYAPAQAPQRLRAFVGDPADPLAGWRLWVAPQAPVDLSFRMHQALGLPWHGLRRGLHYVAATDASLMEPVAMNRLVQGALPALAQGPWLRLVRDLGAELVITPVPLTGTSVAEETSPLPLPGLGSWTVARLRSPPEEVEVHDRWRLASSDQAALTLLAGAGDEAGPVVLFPASPPEQGSAGGAHAEVIQRTDTVLQVRLTSPHPVLVSVHRTADPGWRCTLWDEPCIMGRVNVAQMGVWAPAGEHVLTLRYLLPGAPVAAAAGGVGLLGVAVLFLRARRSRVSAPRWRRHQAC